jgi:hypothetical protein
MTTVNPIQTTTYYLSTSNNPITFGAQTSINAPGTAVSGNGAAVWNVTNLGTIIGTHYGFKADSSTLSNSGTISATGAYGAGVDILTSGGAVTNQKSGYINGGTFGLILYGSGSVSNFGVINSRTSGLVLDGAGTVLNSGSVNGEYSGGMTFLSLRGSLDNTSTGVITGYQAGLALGRYGSTYGSDTVTNAGVIKATHTGGRGISVAYASMTGGITNLAGGTITGGSGIYFIGDIGSVTNAGQIIGQSSTDAGVYMELGGAVTNQAGGTITGGQYGVKSTLEAGTVSNAGLIGGVDGVGFLKNGHITNLTGGVITGVSFGAEIKGSNGTVANSGTVDVGAASGVAVYMAGGVLTNGSSTAAKALIEGHIGAQMQGAGTVTNYGTIEGEGGDAVLFGTSSGMLVADGGSEFVGVVVGAGGAFTLGAGTETFAGGLVTDGVIGGAGVLNLTGGQSTLTAGATLTVADVDVSGAATVLNVTTPSLVYAGRWTQTSGTVSVASGDDLSFTGTASAFAGTLAGAGTIAFTAGTDTLSGTTLTATSVLIDGAAATFSGADSIASVLTVSSPRVTFEGAVGGAGTLAFAGGVQLLDAGTTLTVAHWTLSSATEASLREILSYGGDLTEGAGTTLALGAETLTLTGDSTFAGRVTGTGTLALAGGTPTFNTGASLTIAKLSQSGGAATVAAKLSYAGAFTQSAGTLSVSSGDKLSLSGTGGAFAGTLAGAGTIDFTGGSDTLTGTTLKGAGLSIGAATVTLSGAIDNASAIAVASPSVIIAAAGATLSGAGTVSLSNLATNEITGASAVATLTNVSNKILGAGLLGGGKLTLVNDAGGTIDGDQTTALTINTGTATIANPGTIENQGAGGTLIESALANTGLLEALAGTLTVSGAVTGTGTVRITDGTADFTSTFSENVAFAAKSTGTLELAHSLTYDGTISGFSKTGINSLDLGDIAYAEGTTLATFSGTTASGTLTVTDGTHIARITLKGDYIGSTFTTKSDGHGGTIVVDPTEGAAAPVATPRPAALVPFTSAMAGFGAGTFATHGEEAWRSPPTTNILVRPA